MIQLEVLVGLLLVAAVFFLTTQADMAAKRSAMIATATYVKEQCNRYDRINLASETKSLMRIVESANQIAHGFEEPTTRTDEELLRDGVRDSYVSGALLLDTHGAVVLAYHESGAAPERFSEYLDSEALLRVAQYPKERYANRYICADGGRVDLAATARRDDAGIVVAYYWTPQEYIDSFSLAIDSLLPGYSPEDSGTIVVSNGSTIISCNDQSLIGTSIADLAILSKISQSSQSGKLVYARQQPDGLARYFGLMERGRDCYVYIYLAEREVFGNTIRNVIYALIIYAVVLAVLNMVRYKIGQSYREDQLRIQEAYAKNLRLKNEQLEYAVDQADRANAAKTSFLSRMSHDIRTPLNGIIGLLEINEAHADDHALVLANQRKMKGAANHLLALINDILQMSKLESGEIVLAHEVFDLNQLSTNIRSIVEQQAAEAGITLEYDKTANPVAVSSVYGSPLHLRQIFLNIYSNCIKYNKVGGTVRTTLTCLGQADGVVRYQWVIEDTGIGMKEEFLKHIFDPFAQERVDARSVYQGTGLGMAIVKSLIHQMGGTIDVVSHEGKGSRFTITLPFEIAAALPQPEQKQPLPAADVRGLHLLMAEDNSLNAEIAVALLTDYGITVTVATDGEQAVRRFAENPAGTYAAILMDMMMPVMDGLSATRAIRALPREDARTIPIIAMTANAFKEDAQKCLDAGMNAHLAKPLRVDVVVATIARFCRSAAAQAPTCGRAET